MTRSRKSTAFANRILSIVEEQLHVEANNTPNRVHLTGTDRESKKLWSSIFTFLNHVARDGSQKTLEIIAPQLVKTFIRISDQNDTSNFSNGSIVYEVIALLAKASPPILIEPELAVLSWFLDKLSARKTDKAVTDSIEEALATVLGAYAVALPPDVEDALGTVLLKWATASHPRFQSPDNAISKSTRYNITRFANQCLPYDNLKGRWIDILAIAGNARDNHEIVEEGRRGLDPYWHYMLRRSILPQSDGSGEGIHVRLSFPPFAFTVQAFFMNFPFRLAEPTKADHHSIVKDFTNLLGPDSLQAALRFSRMVLVNEALASGNTTTEVNIDTERALHRSITSSPEDRQKIKNYLRSYVMKPTNQLALLRLLHIALDTFLQQDENAVEPGQILLNFLSLSPSETITGLVPSFRHLEETVSSNNVDVRDLAGQIYGILTSHPSVGDDDRRQSVEALFQRMAAWKAAIGAEVNKVHGSVVALAFFYSRLKFRDMMTSESETKLQRYLTLALSILELSKDRTLQEACFEALRELSTFYVLEPHLLCASASFESTIAKILEAAKSGNEKAIITLGRIGMIFPEQDDDKYEISYVIEQLRELHTLRQIDVQFSVGEALTCVAAGWQSEALAATLDIDGNCPRKNERKDTLQKVVKATLVDCRSPKPSLNKVINILHFLILGADSFPNRQLLFGFCASCSSAVRQMWYKSSFGNVKMLSSED